MSKDTGETNFLGSYPCAACGKPVRVYGWLPTAPLCAKHLREESARESANEEELPAGSCDCGACGVFSVAPGERVRRITADGPTASDLTEWARDGAAKQDDMPAATKPPPADLAERARAWIEKDCVSQWHTPFADETCPRCIASLAALLRDVAAEAEARGRAEGMEIGAAQDAERVAELKAAGKALYDAWNSDLPYVNKMLRLGRALVALGVELRRPAESNGNGPGKDGGG